MHRKLLIALGAAIVLLLCLGLYQLMHDPGPGRAPAAGADSAQGEIPTSLNFSEGVDPAAEIRRAEFEKVNDRELLGPEFLDVFNRFIFEYHQAPRSALMENFNRWLEKNYSEAEAKRIREVFLKYLDYVERMQQPGFFSGSEDTRDQIEKTRRLRREIFGQELADIFFRDEEKSVDYALEVRDIQADESLDEKTKKQRIEELAAGLPPELRDSLIFKDPRQKFIEDQKALAAEMEAMSEEQKAAKMHELRVQHFGEEAAVRLEALDTEMAARRGRLRSYDTARQAFLADPATASLSREEKDARMKALREQHLSPLEQEEAAARETIGTVTEEQLRQWMEQQKANQQQQPAGQ